MVVVRYIPSCLTLSHQSSPSNYISKHIPFGKYKPVCVKKASSVRDDVGLRVFVVSDLHTDYVENMKWVKCLSTLRYNNDVLLVAGDVAETYNNFILTMSTLKDRFNHVFYVPGNHDLWCRREGGDYLHSLKKLNKLLDACKALGVEINPMVINDLGIIPLFSWYHESFDKDKDITSICIPSLEMTRKDFHACKWPEELSSGDTSLALYFDEMNEINQSAIKVVQKTCTQTIMFSHFVPRMFFYPKLPKIIGSDSLELRIRSIHGNEGSGSACHVFGHTHFYWDAVIDGIRYAQAPLAYPRERKRRMNGGENWLPFCIYSEGKFSDKMSTCYWSDYYSVNPRTPCNTQLAPWVA
ncbi:hypothetical protein UlMin_009125 [Ulmus minor]